MCLLVRGRFESRAVYIRRETHKKIKGSTRLYKAQDLTTQPDRTMNCRETIVVRHIELF